MNAPATVDSTTTHAATTSDTSGADASPAHPGRTEFGVITMADRVVSKMVTRAVHDVPQATAPGSRIGQIADALPGLHRNTEARVDVDTDLSVTSIELTIGVRWPNSIPATTAAVRAHVIDTVVRHTGLTVTDVRIHVADLPSDPAPTARVR